MNESALKILNTFTLENIPDLDTVVLGALERFENEKLPSVDLSKCLRPLVVGSGNAEATSRIMFEKVDAVFASESNYEVKLQTIPTIDSVVLISASGAKHAPIIARYAKQLGKKVILITTTENSEARQVLNFEQGDCEYVYPKNREPYTYNTSTYLGMILGQTREDSTKIKTFIEQHVSTIDFSSCSSYDKYFVIVPTKFSSLTRMVQIKFIELFGRTMAHDVETSEYVKHATTVVPSDELFLSFGYENKTWGNENRRLNVPFPEWADYGAAMAITYYVIGKIQKAHPLLFKQHIDTYTKQISEIFGESINPIVE